VLVHLSIYPQASLRPKVLAFDTLINCKTILSKKRRRRKTPPTLNMLCRADQESQKNPVTAQYALNQTVKCLAFISI
jgi:hypothetical protein